jgi:hypothetical protein
MIWLCFPGFVTNPLIASSVVFDLFETALTGFPTNLLNSDDFPAFGAPIRQTSIPLLYAGEISSPPWIADS